MPAEKSFMPRSPRFATSDDVAAIVRVINRAYRVEDFFVHGDRTDEADIRRRLAAPGAGMLLVDDDDGGAAAAVYVELRGDHGYFAMLSVDPLRQGQGLARQLIEAVEGHCRQAGCVALDIEVVNLREELPAFYARFGFGAVGQAQFHDTKKLRREAHLVLMSKAL